MPRSVSNASNANSSPCSDTSIAETKADLSDESNDNGQTAAEPGDQETPRSGQLSRRGHFKSRLGCFNCKRRKIKCNELRPSCSPCRRLGLSCSYPTAQSAIAGSIRANPAPLALEDLQFYHRFLTRAFPTLPLRADELWARCASMSYQSECLAHAALGLGASHLTTHGNIDYTSQALTHRVAAIKLVNQHFVNPPKDQDTADALFAAMLCLSAQTSLLPDAMNEYLSITRAGAMVWAFVMPHHTGSLFKVFTHEIHDETVNSLASDNLRDMTDANNFWVSVEKLKPLCEKPYQVGYQKAVADAVLAVYESSQRAWKAHADLWRVHCFLKEDDFQDFINPENYASQLLAIHMLLIDFVLGPLCAPPTQTIKFSARQGVIVSWARNLLKRLPEGYKVYGEWVSQFCDDLDQESRQYLLTP